MTTFVLVHGGWHGGWCWERVAELLAAAGHESHCPTLSDTPGTGLADHVAEVVQLLDDADLRDVVVVGHSAGGAVVTGVAQRAGRRLAGLAYLDAFVPAPGQSLIDLLPAARGEHFRTLVDDTGRVVLDPETALDGWAVRDPADRAWIAERLRPHPVGALTDPLPADPLPDLPRQYVHCTDKPGGDSFADLAAAARADPTWRFDEIDTGHDAMVTAPDQVAELLRAAWAS